MNQTSARRQNMEWHGHRGARGLLPENTIPAFLRALSYPEVTTLELDVVISADDRVLVSHDPYFNPEICQTADGRSLTESLSLRQLTAAEIAAFDCGRRQAPGFPGQQNRPASVPTLTAVFAAVDRYCLQQGRALPRYNIELKYQPDWEPEFVPGRRLFAELVLAEVMQWGHPELVNLQSFDVPILGMLHDLAPGIPLAYLDEVPGAVREKMNTLGFVPMIYSPWERLLTADICAEARELGLRIIPWTVNTIDRMREVMELGVDGVITDYPDRIRSSLG